MHKIEVIVDVAASEQQQEIDSRFISVAVNDDKWTKIFDVMFVIRSFSRISSAVLK